MKKLRINNFKKLLETQWGAELELHTIRRLTRDGVIKCDVNQSGQRLFGGEQLHNCHIFWVIRRLGVTYSTAVKYMLYGLKTPNIWTEMTDEVAKTRRADQDWKMLIAQDNMMPVDRPSGEK